MGLRPGDFVGAILFGALIGSKYSAWLGHSLGQDAWRGRLRSWITAKSDLDNLVLQIAFIEIHRVFTAVVLGML